LNLVKFANPNHDDLVIDCPRSPHSVQLESRINQPCKVQPSLQQVARAIGCL
jgi:hypothetical protein